MWSLFFDGHLPMTSDHVFQRALSAARAALLLTGGLAAQLAGAQAQAAPMLTAHVPDAVSQHRAVRVMDAPAGRELHVAFALPMHDLDKLDALLADLYNPASPRFRHYLSVPDFTARFSPSAADYDRTVRFLAAQGLKITGTAANRYLIDATGTVGTLQAALHVKFGMYKHPTENRLFIAPDREPSLDLNVAVLHVTGLDDYSLPVARRAHRDANAGRGVALTGSAPGGDYLGSDIRAAYYGKGPLTGAGQAIGLMELAPYNDADIAYYFTKYGPQVSTVVQPISTDGSPALCSTTCDDGEQALDIEYAISVAPGLALMQVYTAQSPESVLNRMASDNTSAQLSTSWGWRENPTDDAIFMEMAAQGQTMLTASGDYSSLRASGPWPEESAYLTGVGGTDLATTGPGGAWASETGWSDSAGGPSVDKTIIIPAYQLPFISKKTGGSLKLRNVPDIAGDANFDNFECYAGTCQGGWGGTSFASPIWSGFIALANQQATINGEPRVGFLNPTLYRLGLAQHYTSYFHDQTSGKSGKFNALPGFDLVTGFGSPTGAALITALLAP